MNKYNFAIGLFLGGLMLLSGCSGLGGYGRVTGQPTGKPVMTIEGLLEDWQKYHVYYAGNLDTFPSAILFDPKEDGKVIRAEKWIKITDFKALSTQVFWMRTHGRLHPFVWRILGPEGGFFGYFYSPWNQATIKVVDATTLSIYDIPYPPGLEDRGPALRRH